MHSIVIDTHCKPIAYAWPGGYPVYYLARDGFRNDETGELEFNQYDRGEHIMCSGCAENAGKEWSAIITAQEVNWEDTDLHCEYCEKPIESAYGEPQT